MNVTGTRASIRTSRARAEIGMRNRTPVRPVMSGDFNHRDCSMRSRNRLTGFTQRGQVEDDRFLNQTLDFTAALPDSDAAREVWHGSTETRRTFVQ